MFKKFFKKEVEKEPEWEPIAYRIKTNMFNGYNPGEIVYMHEGKGYGRETLKDQDTPIPVSVVVNSPTLFEPIVDVVDLFINDGRGKKVATEHMITLCRKSLNMDMAPIEFFEKFIDNGINGAPVFKNKIKERGIK